MHLFQFDDYKSEMMQSLGEAWKLAQENIGKAQKSQKEQHDKKARDAKFSVGERVFVFMPAKKTGKAYKFAKPFEGPYRVLATYDNGADVCLVDKPTSPSIRVAMDRLRLCPSQIPTDVKVSPKRKRGRPKKRTG